MTVSQTPIFIEVPEPLVANKGEPAELVCKAHGKPIPEIMWLKGDEPLRTSDKLVIQGSADADSFESESRLLFEKVELNDEFENYTMVATNSVGSVSHDVGLMGMDIFCPHEISIA